MLNPSLRPDALNECISNRGPPAGGSASQAATLSDRDVARMTPDPADCGEVCTAI